MCWDFIGQNWRKTNRILQVRATNTILHDCIPLKSAVLFLYSERIYNTEVYNSDLTDGGARVWTSPLAKLNVKPSPHLAYISVFSILLVFSRLLLFFFLKSFGFFSGTIRFYHGNPHPDTLSFLIFFWVLASGPSAVNSGPPFSYVSYPGGNLLLRHWSTT